MEKNEEAFYDEINNPEYQFFKQSFSAFPSITIQALQLHCRKTQISTGTAALDTNIPCLLSQNQSSAIYQTHYQHFHHHLSHLYLFFFPLLFLFLLYFLLIIFFFSYLFSSLPLLPSHKFIETDSSNLQ